MSPEEQRAAISEICGWKYVADPELKTVAWACWVRPGMDDWHTAEPPDFTRDLNACHEMEAFLKTAGQAAGYCEELNNVIRDKPSKRNCYAWDWHESAAQRCEAFLKTLPLWKEVQP